MAGGGTGDFVLIIIAGTHENYSADSVIES